MKNELGGRIMAEFAELIPKPYRYLIDDDDDDENRKATKKCVIKGILKLEKYRHFLEAT